jgi:hypothetical protein
MTDPTFPDKLRRAREHAKTFQEATQWWLEDKPYRVVEETDTKTDTKEFVVLADRQPPARLALMYGDAIQNLRSSLDYLVGDLARKNSGGTLRPAIARRLQFPITTTQSNFDRAIADRRLQCVPPDAIALIQGVQPHGDRNERARHHLWALHQLSNMDKHRHIAIITSVVRGIQGGNILIGSVNEFGYGKLGPFKERAVIAFHRPANADVDVDLGQLTIGVALGEGLPGAGQDPEGVLGGILEWIAANVINPLGAFL